MKTYLDKTILNLVSVFLVLLCLLPLLVSCDKSEVEYVSVLPEEIGKELFFRGFVTDEDEELVSQIYNFSRKVVRRDNVDGKDVLVFDNAGKETFFYTDEAGAVWQRDSENISQRAAQYGLTFKKPFILTRWKLLLKQAEGEGAEWTDNVDTTFTMFDLADKKQTIRYRQIATARHDGLQNAFLPSTYQYEKAIDVFWYRLDTFIINETKGDTLFSTRGTAHQYFMPGVGAVKYITDFIKSELGQDDVALRGTWELVKKPL